MISNQYYFVYIIIKSPPLQLISMINPEQIVKSEQEINGYRLEKAIGKDVDNRIVFKAVNYKRERVAIKIIPIYPETLDFVFNQALFCSQINHPSITASMQFMIRQNNTQLVLFMEYCDGNLGTDIRKIRNQDLGQCAKSIIDAVYHIHEVLNITHCDLRPQSIQISPTTPKVSFYSVQISQQVPSQCYLPPEFSGTHTREGDMWALGLILIELFSKKRLNQIIPDLKGKRKPAHQIRRFSMTQLLKDIRSLRLRNLLKQLLRHDPQSRPTISQFYVRMLGMIQSEEFMVKDPIEEAAKKQRMKKQYEMQRPQRPKMRITPSQLLAQSLMQRKQKQTNEKVLENEMNRSIERYKVQCEAFRLSNIKDRSKLRILKLSEMKILKIEQIYDVPNLEWLYLQRNLIMKIENLDYPRLKGLDLNNNKLFKIENLQNLKSLEQLYLHENLIQKIQNLEQLSSLKEIYLNDNSITVVENLDGIECLKKVALKRNNIDRFESANANAIKKLQNKNVTCFLE